VASGTCALYITPSRTRNSFGRLCLGNHLDRPVLDVLTHLPRPSARTVRQPRAATVTPPVLLKVMLPGGLLTSKCAPAFFALCCIAADLCEALRGTHSHHSYRWTVLADAVIVQRCLG
jgi:hypothetical protein